MMVMMMMMMMLILMKAINIGTSRVITSYSYRTMFISFYSAVIIMGLYQ